MTQDPLRARAEQIAQAVDRLRTEVAISRDIGMNQNEQFANDIEAVLDQLASLTAAHERVKALPAKWRAEAGERDYGWANELRKCANDLESALTLDGGASQA